MTENRRMSESAERWLNFGERVGGPTIALILVMVGIYNLAVPIVDSAVSYMATQTELLKEMRDDLAHTRDTVERDASERKAELLQKLQIQVDQGFKQIERQIQTHKGNNEK